MGLGEREGGRKAPDKKERLIWQTIRREGDTRDDGEGLYSTEYGEGPHYVAVRSNWVDSFAPNPHRLAPTLPRRAVCVSVHGMGIIMPPVATWKERYSMSAWFPDGEDKRVEKIPGSGTDVEPRRSRRFAVRFRTLLRCTLIEGKRS